MRSMRIGWVVWLCVASSAWAQDAGQGAAEAAAPPAPPVVAEASPVEKLDTLWKTRDEEASLKDGDATIRAALKDKGEDYAVLWRAARLRWWVADGAKNEKLKKQIAKEGWLFAERALKVNGSGAEAKYYLALNIGAYSQAVGILTALGEGLEGKFLENLDFAIKNIESFDRYGPRNAKGRYWWELPWPKRDLAKSKTDLEFVAGKHPEHLRAWLYLAETHLKDGKPKDAKAAMDKVLQGSGAYDPPEARRIKDWAKPVAEEIEKALK